MFVLSQYLHSLFGPKSSRLQSEGLPQSPRKRTGVCTHSLRIARKESLHAGHDCGSPTDILSTLGETFQSSLELNWTSSMEYFGLEQVFGPISLTVDPKHGPRSGETTLKKEREYEVVSAPERTKAFIQTAARVHEPNQNDTWPTSERTESSGNQWQL